MPELSFKQTVEEDYFDALLVRRRCFRRIEQSGGWSCFGARMRGRHGPGREHRPPDCKDPVLRSGFTLQQTSASDGCWKSQSFRSHIQSFADPDFVKGVRLRAVLPSLLKSRFIFACSLGYAALYPVAQETSSIKAPSANFRQIHQRRSS